MVTKSTAWLSPLLVVASIGITAALSGAVTVRVDRWLSLRQATGDVTVFQGNTSRTGRLGDRLQFVGDGVKTATQSTAVLDIDTQVGFIDVAENTEVRIRALDVAADNGRITHLAVPQGQVRVRVRPFTHRGSELEIETPAGVSGVRGTEFGMNIQATDGKTSVATLTGAVATNAQGVAVLVPGGYQNYTIPGEPPTPPTPLRDDPSLRYRLNYVLEGSRRYVQIQGSVDPVNTVFFRDEPQTVDKTGNFVISLPARLHLNPEITVVTPLGTRRVHEVPIF